MLYLLRRAVCALRGHTPWPWRDNLAAPAGARCWRCGDLLTTRSLRP